MTMTRPDNDFWVWADWPAPAHVYAGTSTRMGGYSLPPYKALNLADHVDDNPQHIHKNRALLNKSLKLTASPVWLEQTHSAKIISLDSEPDTLRADGSTTTTKDNACVVMTADCVPLLFCNKKGSRIAAIHAGWKGICMGIINNAIKCFPVDEPLLVWIGPCISQKHYEVGSEVYNRCMDLSASLKAAFQQKDAGHWLCSLSEIVKIILKNNGVEGIYECGLCTYERDELFYSYRRDGETGRTASMIWIA